MLRIITGSVLAILLSQPALATPSISYYMDKIENVAQKTMDIAQTQYSNNKAKYTNTTSTKKSLYPFDNFRNAKKELNKYLKSNPYTFYANCRVVFTSKTRFHPDLNSCNYKSNGDLFRAKRIEWEHLTPISWTQNHFKKCWSNGGRANCIATDSAFAAAEADPVNLVPSIGEINKDRSYFKYGELSQGFDYGTNNRILFNKKAKRFMPPKEKQGWVARAHLYMRDTYGVKYSSSYTRLINKWARGRPTQQECHYNRVLNRYGFNNPYTQRMCN